jgi:3D (Asp-Asp-Asp) domain-containing protein
MRPARGYFVGKVKIFAKALVVVVLLGYPAIIQADTAVPQLQSTVPTPPAAPAAATVTKTVWVTAYASVPDETSDHPFITASGATVHDGVVAANFLPFGTKIEIPALFGDKVFTVEDRTSAKFGGRVDIWMPSVGQAVNFGIQHAKIVILDQNLALK